MITRRDFLELYVAELGRHEARHGLELYLSKGYTFGRLPTGARRAPKASSSRAPLRGRVQRGERLLKPRPSSTVNRLVDKISAARDVVANMRASGATPATVQRWIVTQTPYTLRQVFAACSDEFERRCYGAAS